MEGKDKLAGRKRVMVVIDRYLPIIGGAQNNVHQLCRYLLERGFDITVLTRRIYPELPVAEKIDGIQVRRFGYAPVRLLSKLLCAVAITVWLIRYRNSTDVVVSVPCVNTTDMLPVYLAHLFTHVPYVVRITSMENNFDLLLRYTRVSFGKWLMNMLLPPGFYRQIYRQAYAVVVQSEVIRDHAQKLGIKGCLVIANGIETSRFFPVSADRRAVLRKELGLPADRLIAVYTSRYGWQKNQKALIEAVERINEQSLGCRIYALIIGASERNHEESVEKQLRAYVADRGIEDDVAFVNDSAVVERYLQAANLFVMPTIHPEGMPNALLEAMACGLPAVVSDQPLLRCMFPKGAGVFVDPKDVSSIASRIIEFCEDDRRRVSVGSELVKHARTHFSVETAIESYIRLLLSAASIRNRSIAPKPENM